MGVHGTTKLVIAERSLCGGHIIPSIKLSENAGSVEQRVNSDLEPCTRTSVFDSRI
jgi:hypothetical protein